jgi:hypothetical protein
MSIVDKAQENIRRLKALEENKEDEKWARARKTSEEASRDFERLRAWFDSNCQELNRIGCISSNGEKMPGGILYSMDTGRPYWMCQNSIHILWPVTGKLRDSFFSKANVDAVRVSHLFCRGPRIETTFKHSSDEISSEEEIRIKFEGFFGYHAIKQNIGSPFVSNWPNSQTGDRYSVFNKAGALGFPSFPVLRSSEIADVENFLAVTMAFYLKGWK